MALMLPAIGRTMGSARAFRCQMALRSVAFDFQIFAEDRFTGDRGDDSGRAPFFRVETFQDAQYGVDEFWSHGGEDSASIEGSEAAERMACAEVGAEVTARRNMPCAGGALSPAENVSYGFNLRLHRAEVQSARGPRLAPVWLSSAILAEGGVPLLWDIDGSGAADLGVVPVFTAPSMGSAGPFAGERYWFPGMRHGRGMNIAFMDGHVAATREPLREAGARWEYQPSH